MRNLLFGMGMFFLAVVLVVGIAGLYDGVDQVLAATRQTQEHVAALEGQMADINGQVTTIQKTITHINAKADMLEQKVVGISAKVDNAVIGGWAGQGFMDWLTRNGVMDYATFQKVTDDCMWGDVANYPCVIYPFKYQDDGQKDYAKGYDEFIVDNGGDCEDYAIFFAAWYRRAKENGYTVRLYKEGDCDFILFHDGRYYEHACAVDVKPYKVQVVCGLEEDGNVSHCINRIKAEDGTMYWVEPQSGEILDSNPLETYDIVITLDGAWWYGKEA